MRHRRAFLIAMIALTVGAFAFRLPALGIRPFHGDEAVHAFKFLDLWVQGVYRYDHNEFHGPTLYYAALPSIWLHGRHSFASCTESDFRLPIVLFGAAMVLVIAPLSSGLGKRAIFCAGILAAISPALVFYSRYYIQETLLAFFTLATIACGWQYSRHMKRRWLLLAGVSAGLMIASKETAVLSFAAVVGAMLLTPVWTRLVEGQVQRSWKTWPIRLVAISIGVALFVACLFISGFGTNHDGPLGVLTGPVDYLRSYTPWLHRARGATQHVYPWHYYLDILLWTKSPRGPIYSEAPIVILAIVGALAGLLPHKKRVGRELPPKWSISESRMFRGSSALVRFLTFYSLILTALYSAIPYKTPWCLLSFLCGMILLAGVGAVALLQLARSIPVQVIVGVVLAAGCVQLEVQAYRASYVTFTDPENPYVYAQPVADAVNLGARASDIARYSGIGPDMVVKIVWGDDYHWPIPWYLRQFKNTGFYHDTSDPAAPLLLASPEFEEDLTKKLDKTHILTPSFGIRPGVIAQVWVRNDVWEKYLKNRPKPKDDD